MLPQTNLQLYRVLIERGARDVDLVQTRSAYDLARKLFATSFRPSHKPFVCHLVGVAGALATWNQPPHVVVAGLLHSAYLFGEFGDGQRGAVPCRRRIMRDAVGAEAESLVERYTHAKWAESLELAAAEAAKGDFDRECLLLKLADVCDECADSGPHFSPGKNVGFGVGADRRACDAAARLLGELAGSDAASHFAAVTAALEMPRPPASLVTADRSYHVVARAINVPEHKSIRLRIRRFTQVLGRKRAA